MPQSQPPRHPPSNQFHPTNPTASNQPPLPCFSKSANLPDFLLTALSLFLFITAPKHHLPPRALSLSSPPPSTNRRFLRLTSTMSQNPNPNSTAFPTPQSLSDWLKPRLPSDSFASWGTKPGTKNVHNLWLELADGETSLVDKSPPIRNLEVVCVRVLYNHNRVLIESHQELSDGSIRKRGRPLSEKLKSGEDIEAAVKRAIKEELGSVRDPPEERDPLRIFYETLYQQIPTSELAAIWMMESGLLPLKDAMLVYEKKMKKSKSQRVTSPSKPTTTVKETKSVTVKKKVVSSTPNSSDKKKKIATTTVTKHSKKRKAPSSEEDPTSEEDSEDDYVLSKKKVKKARVN